MIAYPTTLPLDAAALIAEIVKSRAVKTRRAEFAQAGWNVQGYIQKVTIGEAVAPDEFGCDNDCDCDFETVADVLMNIEAELTSFQEEPITFGAEDPEESEAESISIITILSIVGAVLQAIQLWRNRNKEQLES
jgi:hypothetical protein